MFLISFSTLDEDGLKGKTDPDRTNSVHKFEAIINKEKQRRTRPSFVSLARDI